MRPGLVITLLAVALLAGCGSTPPPAPDDPGSDQPADAGGEHDSPEGGRDDDDSGDAVVSVSMTQQGGLTGVVRTWRISERHPRHEHVFAAADRDVLEDPTTRTAEQSLCCDLLEYEVVIRYADGSTKRLRTWDADDTDPALQNLVTAVIDSEPWHLDAEGQRRGGSAG